MAEIQNQTICKYSTFNQENTMDNRAATVVQNPSKFYDYMYKYYLDSKQPGGVPELKHYIDVVPTTVEKAYRRLWFDLDCCREENEFTDLSDNNIHMLIERISQLFLKIYNPNNMNIITTKKLVNRKEKANGLFYSWGMHVFTNWFIKTDLLTYMYNEIIEDDMIKSICNTLHVNSNEFIDGAVIANKNRNNGVMMLGCSKNNTPSTYDFYDMYESNSWQKINFENSDIIKNAYYSTLLNYNSPNDVFVCYSNYVLFSELLNKNNVKRYLHKILSFDKDTINSFTTAYSITKAYKDINPATMDNNSEEVDNYEFNLLEQILTLISEIDNGYYFESHNEWYKLIRATNNYNNSEDTLNIFMNISNSCSHTRSLQKFKSTWNNTSSYESYNYFKDSSYLFFILQKHNKLPIDCKNDYIFCHVMKSISRHNEVTSQAFVELFKTFCFNDRVMVEDISKKFVKIYAYDEFNVLRNIHHSYDVNFFESEITSFANSIADNFQLAKQFKKEIKSHIFSLNKLQNASKTNEKNYKEWLARYQKTYAISYETFRDIHLKHRENVIYTNVGFVVPLTNAPEPTIVDDWTAEFPGAQYHLLNSPSYDVIPYEKEDIIFEEMIINAQIVPKTKHVPEDFDAIKQFQRHVLRYCGGDGDYADAMMQIICQSLYCCSDHTWCYILYGTSGANGKTITTDIMKNILGNNQCIPVNPDNFEETSASPFLLNLHNKTMYYMNELSEHSGGFKKSVNPLESRIFKELCEKKSDATARLLHSNVIQTYNYTGILFVTSNIQPTAVNAGPLERRVVFLPSLCRYLPPSSVTLYEPKGDYLTKRKRYNTEEEIQIAVNQGLLAKKKNHYPMDPNVSFLFKKHTNAIFSWLIFHYLERSLRLNMDMLQGIQAIATCKEDFLEKCSSGYNMKDFVKAKLQIDPFFINVVSLEDIFIAYKDFNKDAKFTIQTNLDKFFKQLCTAFLANSEFYEIDMLDYRRTHQSNYYKDNSAVGIKGILIDKSYNYSVNMKRFTEDYRISTSVVNIVGFDANLFSKNVKKLKIFYENKEYYAPYFGY
ncbi:hypothetical protein WA158_006926 [Blastocystis sp. Blastoise]